MSVLEKIKLNNQKLGIATIFYNANDEILGYSEKNRVYLNVNYIEDIEKINKHEVLHFYKDSKQFKVIKNIIFSILKSNEINKLRNEYYIKYMSLYSEEEIKEGVLDEEIIIDMIVKNGNFSIDIDKYIKDPYEVITTESKAVTLSKEVKRYLNLSLSKKIDGQFPHLNKWEKLFVLNYYNGRDRIIPCKKETKHEEVRNDIKRELEKLYDYGNKYNNFVFNLTSKDLRRKIEIEIERLIKDGEIEVAEHVKKNMDKNIMNRASIIANNLQREYQNIVKTLQESGYDDAFKYLMLQETINRIYKKENIHNEMKRIVDKRIEHETAVSHMVLNDYTLKNIYDNVGAYQSFVDLYFDSLERFNEKVKLENSVNFENVDTFGMGRWIRFEGKNNNEKEFLNNAQRLTTLVEDTIWCTKTQASSHLEQGDYYVFVDNDGKPHIAVKMIGNDISELRGIENDVAQDLEEEYRKVAVEFLQNNTNIRYGMEWLKKEEWNKRLLTYINKIKKGSFNEEYYDSLVYDLTEVSDYKIHFAKNKNKEILLKLVKDIPEICDRLASKYGCKVSDICFGDCLHIDKCTEEFPFSVVMGDLILKENINCSKLKCVIGDASFVDGEIKELSSLEYIGGDLILNNSKIESIPNLRLVRGKLSAPNTKNLKDLSSLAEIQSDVIFNGSNIENLENLARIGGNANFSRSKIRRLKNLKYVKNTLNINDSYIENLSSLEYVGGNADFSCSKLKLLNPDCKIIGKINMANTPLEQEMIRR